MSGHTAEVGADLLPAIGVGPLHFPLMGAHLMEQSNLVCFLSACPMSELRALWGKGGTGEHRLSSAPRLLGDPPQLADISSAISVYSFIVIACYSLFSLCADISDLLLSLKTTQLVYTQSEAAVTSQSPDWLTRCYQVAPRENTSATSGGEVKLFPRAGQGQSIHVK